MDTRTLLMDHAERLFALGGVDGTGVQDIVEAAGVTKPTLYHYFGSKEGLVQTVLDRGWAALNRTLDEVGPYGRDLPPHLHRLAAAWIDAVRAQPDWFRVQLSLTFMPPSHGMAALVRPGVMAIQGRFEILFSEAAGQYGNMRGRHRLLAAAWVGNLNHWTGIVLGGWSDGNLEFVQAGTRQFLYGIFS